LASLAELKFYSLDQRAMIACSAAKPSVSAAGPAAGKRQVHDQAGKFAAESM
jgi:hypothetical protein